MPNEIKVNRKSTSMNCNILYVDGLIMKKAKMHHTTCAMYPPIFIYIKTTMGGNKFASK